MSSEKFEQSKTENSEEKQRRSFETSVLFEPTSMRVILGLLIIAIWYRFIPLIVVSVFLLLLYMIISIWKNTSLIHVKPGIQLSKSRLFTGDEFEIRARLHNDKWLPLVWIEWEFPETEGVSFEDNDPKATFRFLWLLWFQKIEWSLTAKAIRRGVYNIGQIILRSGDGFRFAETEKPFDLDAKVYIYPKLVPVNVTSFRPSMQWRAKGKKGGFIEDPLMVIGVREYQPGDELKRLNWRAAARTGALQTNTYQPVITEQLIIYIDVQGFEIEEGAYQDPSEQKKYEHNKREAFEWFLSVIASVAVKYNERGISIGFATNGLAYNGKKMQGFGPSANLNLFLDQLAEITQRAGVSSIAALDRMLGMGWAHTPIFVFSHHVTKAQYAWYRQNRDELSELCFYYTAESECSKMLASKAKSINVFI